MEVVAIARRPGDPGRSPHDLGNLGLPSGIYSGLMGFYSDLMGFYSDLMGFIVI